MARSFVMIVAAFLILTCCGKKRILLTLAAMALALTACGQNSKKEMKTLVAYFSATGTTEAVANKDFAAAYPKINWKAGKTLNGASKADIKSWVEGLK